MDILQPLPDQYTDFRNFLYLVWKCLGLPDPTPIQYEIADYLQNGRDIEIEAFRGCGKTWITAAFAVWCLRLDPEKKVLVISASSKHARAVTQFCLTLIETIPELSCLIPKFDQRKSMEEFDVRPAGPHVQPSFRALGIASQLPGNRANLIIFDDVEVPGNSDTEGKREKLKDQIKESQSIILPDDPEARIVFLGTPQSSQSIYTDLAKVYARRIWPSEVPDLKYGHSADLAPSILARQERGEFGEPTEPLRFGKEYLEEKKAKIGLSTYRLQFMLDTSLSDRERYPLRLSDLIVTDVDAELAPEKIVWSSDKDRALPFECPGFDGDRFFGPAWVSDIRLPYHNVIMFVDPSGRGKDETGYVILGVLNSTIYALDWGGLQGGYSEEVLEYLAKKAGTFKVRQMYEESNMGDGMFAQLMTPYLHKFAQGCRIESCRSHKQKEMRICDTLEPVLNQHRLVLNKRLVVTDAQTVSQYPGETATFYQGLWQLAHITRDRGALSHDDRLDALALGVAKVVELMSLDVDSQIKSREDEWLQQEIDRFVEAGTSSVLRPRSRAEQVSYGGFR